MSASDKPVSARGKPAPRGRPWPIAVLAALMLATGTIPPLPVPALAPASALAADGFANISLFPKRVVIEGRERSGTFVLINRGNAAATYRIGFVEMVQDETGDLRQVSALPPGHASAAAMLRYTPRQIHLGPGEAQTVRVLARKPADLPPGEYRSHMLIQALPEGGGRDIALVARGGDDLVQVELNPVYGVAVPVIVREGRLAAELAITEAALMVAPDGGTRLGLELARQGDRSVYGALEAVYRPDGGPPVVVGEARGIAVYHPYDSRRYQLALDWPDGVRPGSGTLVIGFDDLETEDGTRLAETRLPLAP